MEILAVDIGFGFTKASNGNKSLIFKSILGDASDIQFRGKIIQDSSSDDHIQIEVNGRSYFIGELAERQSEVRSFTLDQTLFFNSHLKPLALAAAASMTSSFVPVGLVTGLPIGFYLDYKDVITKNLQGDHKV